MDDLRSLDEDLYKNLMYVKRHTGDVADLGLTFSVDYVHPLSGKHEAINLIPNGENIPVTNQNRSGFYARVGASSNND